MVVCLKHIGITDSDSEDICKLDRACSQYSVRPYGLVNAELFKGLTHKGCGEHDHTLFRNSGCSHACFSVICLEVSI